MSNYICCDGIARRDFIRVGAITGFSLGFGLQSFLAHAATEGDNPNVLWVGSQSHPKRRARLPSSSASAAGRATWTPLI